MFERFTERARMVVVYAQDEARALKHNSIGTEHILLGLLREEDGLAARALGALGVTLEAARVEVDRILGQGDEIAAGQIPFTPRAKRALELSLREALSIGHNSIGTEHILLGLVRENDGVASRMLLDLHVTADAVRTEVFGLLGVVNPATESGLGDDTVADRRVRLTRGSRKVLFLAQEEARALKHARMGTEHILLGLLREEHGLAARLLDALEITADHTRAQVVRLAGPGKETTTGHIDFTPQAKSALERARAEAISLEHTSVGTEHILLGLMRQEDGIAARILREGRS